MVVIGYVFHGCYVLKGEVGYVQFHPPAWVLWVELFDVQWDAVGSVHWVVGDRLKGVVGYIEFHLPAYVLWVELFGVQWDGVGSLHLVVGKMSMVQVGCMVMQEVGCVLEP